MWSSLYQQIWLMYNHGGAVGATWSESGKPENSITVTIHASYKRKLSWKQV
jgi:hypothetical protein